MGRLQASHCTRSSECLLVVRPVQQDHDQGGGKCLERAFSSDCSQETLGYVVPQENFFLEVAIAMPGPSVELRLVDIFNEAPVMGRRDVTREVPGWTFSPLLLFFPSLLSP